MFLISMAGATSAADSLACVDEHGGCMAGAASMAVLEESCSGVGFESVSASAFFSLATAVGFWSEEDVGSFCAVRWFPEDWKTEKQSCSST